MIGQRVLILVFEVTKALLLTLVISPPPPPCKERLRVGSLESEV